LFRRNKGVFYLQNNETGIQKSLGTRDPRQAKKLLDAANDGRQTSDLNLHLGKTYLAHADPTAVTRAWQDVINVFRSRDEIAESTRARYEREFQTEAYAVIRQKPLAQTTSDDLRAVMKRGTKYTNGILRTLHNFALGNGWLHWHIIKPKQWPACPKTLNRAITEQEYQKIIAVEGNTERRLYYQMLWETGAAQTDGACLTAEMFDWTSRLLIYVRAKTGEPCHLQIGPSLEGLVKKLPASGLLFPKIAIQKNNHRAAQFRRRCKQLGFAGISLHSFRYSWAQRANIAGIPERYAQAALGHSSKAVHHAYAKNAFVVCPSIDAVRNVIPLIQSENQQPAITAR